MGLHLNYELRLPGAMTSDDVTRSLLGLRATAIDLPFKDVSPLYHGSVAGAVVSEFLVRRFRFLASVIAEVSNQDGGGAVVGVAESAQGFLVNPGEGCETAPIGFLRRADADGRTREWFWHWSCKTQYASVISDQHLVTCHGALVKLLDRALELGIEVVVRDETHFWETRDELRLLQEVHAMNRVVAAFAGKLRDVTPPAHELRAPIFRHPGFEHLEMGEDVQPPLDP